MSEKSGVLGLYEVLHEAVKIGPRTRCVRGRWRWAGLTTGPVQVLTGEPSPLNL